MCVPREALPPVPIIRGAVVNHERLVLDAADGNRLLAFEARASDPAGPAVVVLPDVRGLFPFYEELALRFAERGIDAVTIDYFGRTAGIEARPDDFDFMPHVYEATHEGVRADVAAGVERLGGAQARPIFTVGFCFGGSNSWHQAANGLGLAGVIGFYGNPTREGVPIGAPAIVDRAGDMTCPVLALMAGDDPGIPAEAIESLSRALDEAAVSNEVVTYEGAPHSFFDRTYEVFQDQSADAWDRTLAFIDAASAAA